MRSLAMATLAIVGLANLTFGQQATQTLTLPGQTPAASSGTAASYGIGYDIGSNLAAGGLTTEDISQKEFFAGLMDALAKKEPSLELDAIQAAMQALGKTIMDRKNKVTQAFLDENKKKDGVQVTESGLQYEVLKAGSGASPKADSKVSVHYEGKLVSGQVFDSSIQRGQPASFGVSQVIPGWTEALLRMKVGDKWRLVLPPSIAYGERGSPPAIGPNEVLIFEVELLSVQ